MLRTQKFDQIINICSNLLNNFLPAKQFLDYVDHRISKEAQLKFQLGYFPDLNNLNVLDGIIDNKILFDTELVYNKKIFDAGQSFEVIQPILQHHNLVMPYKDVYGEIIAMVGRTLLSDSEREDLNISKYKNTFFDKGKHLFGLFDNKHDIIKENCAIIVEGQFDCITCVDYGIKNVVALGSASFTESQAALLLRYTDNIKIMLDNDPAGIKGRDKIIKRYKNIFNIKQIFIPDGYKDIDEFLKDGGKLDFIS